MLPAIQITQKGIGAIIKVTEVEKNKNKYNLNAS